MAKRSIKQDSEFADHRVQFLLSLDEESFRQIILIPLMTRLGYRDVIEYHGGSSEKGKDIICWYNDPMENRRYVALVVKKGDIHGSVGRKGSASEVLYQIQQTLNEPYRDRYGLKEIRIDECIVATTGKIKNTSIESISGSIRASNMDRLLKFLDGKRLIDLLTKNMPEFWLNEQPFMRLILHEMRGPLSSIAGSAAMLKEYSNKLDADKLHEIASRIASHVEIAHMLAERQFFLGTKTQLAYPSMTIITDELRNIIDEYNTIFGLRKGHNVVLNIKGELGAAFIDDRAFKQAMFNVLSNAAKNCERKKSIEIIASQNGPQLIIRVRNYGVGISPDLEELMFQPFYSASPHGSGLELYIARKLLLAIEGDIRVTRLADPTEISLYLKRDNPNDHNA
jgi:nitrogen-specific signal transduction histidine kinase